MRPGTQAKTKRSIPKGFTRVGSCIPDPVAAARQRVLKGLPGVTSKARKMDAVALSIICSLPADVREDLYRWGHVNDNDPSTFPVGEALPTLLDSLRRHGHLPNHEDSSAAA